MTTTMLKILRKLIPRIESIPPKIGVIARENGHFFIQFRQLCSLLWIQFLSSEDAEGSPELIKDQRNQARPKVNIFLKRCFFILAILMRTGAEANNLFTTINLLALAQNVLCFLKNLETCYSFRCVFLLLTIGTYTDSNLSRPNIALPFPQIISVCAVICGCIYKWRLEYF